MLIETKAGSEGSDGLTGYANHSYIKIKPIEK